jgi:hypothetical protein
LVVWLSIYNYKIFYCGVDNPNISFLHIMHGLLFTLTLYI